jgi:hypothetical protein
VLLAVGMTIGIVVHEATVSAESVYFVSPCGGSLSGASCVYVCVLADVNECEDPWACANGGTCYNTEGGYACACTAGWADATCETGGSRARVAISRHLVLFCNGVGS